ncbi:MAG: response regulator transcription factor [Candidatus Sericytochromatia bacterium]
MSTDPVRVLIIDDSVEMIDVLSQLLAKENCEVVCASTSEEGLRLHESFAPEIVLSDIMLPDGNGMDICRHIRQKDPYCQILLLSALKEELDKVLGLELGADDYITKPFSSRELRSRVRAAIRRLELFRQAGGSAQTEPELPTSETLEIENLTISFASRRVWQSQSEVELTRKEFELLVLLASNRGRVFSRQDLLEKLWQHNPDINERSIDAQIRRLRDKIEPDVQEPFYIETVRGSGYRFHSRD